MTQPPPGLPEVAERGSAAYFARLSQELMRTKEEKPTRQRVAEEAVAVLPSCDFTAISRRRRGRQVETVAHTSPDALRADELQYSLEEGPCVDAVFQDESYLCNDTRDDARWPAWGPSVWQELGVGSVLSLRLGNAEETLGAMNLYARAHDAFSDQDIELALVYATHSANALSSAKLVTGLQTAVQSRHLIGVAQGILMASYGLSVQQSFDVLRRYSSNMNIKLRDVAEMVVQQGRLPSADGATPDPVEP